jgi:hypothetical protein
MRVRAVVAVGACPALCGGGVWEWRGWRRRAPHRRQYTRTRRAQPPGQPQPTTTARLSRAPAWSPRTGWPGSCRRVGRAVLPSPCEKRTPWIKQAGCASWWRARRRRRWRVWCAPIAPPTRPCSPWVRVRARRPLVRGALGAREDCRVAGAQRLPAEKRCWRGCASPCVACDAAPYTPVHSPL